jgi:AraC family transcriptional regulator
MIYTEHMEKAFLYIEEHLDGECSLEGSAHAAGYSMYHFSRIFKSMTSISPISYVRKRRLTLAAKDVAETVMPLIDISIKWGFESSETFIRAFEAEHGITPGRYRGTGMSLHLTNPFRVPDGKPFRLPEPEIVMLPDRTLCGYPFYMKPGMKHGSIPAFFNSYHERQLAYTLPGVSADGWFDDVGCSIYSERGRVAYITGVWSERKGPEGTVTLTIPAGLHAVFSTPPADAFSFVETIHNTWDAVYQQWLPMSPYQRAPGPDYETYCEISHTFTEKIHIPIMKRRECHEKQD